MGKSRQSRLVEGTRFGDLEIVSVETGVLGGVKSIQCRCLQCGSICSPAPGNVAHGRTTRCASCGRKASIRTRTRFGVDLDAGLRRRLGNRVSAIFARCYDPSNPGYKNYGARGVVVHADWVRDRVAFVRYIAALPGAEDSRLELDRIDVDLGYEPGNLRFISHAAQQANRQDTVWVEWRGERMCGTNFWRRYAPKYCRAGTVLRKLREGVSPEQIIDEQRHCRGSYLRHKERGAT